MSDVSPSPAWPAPGLEREVPPTAPAPPRSTGLPGDLLDMVVDNSPDWIFAKDAAHRFLFVNRAFARAHDTTPAAMLGRLDADFWPAGWTEDHPATGHVGFHSDDRRVLAGETIRRTYSLPVPATGEAATYEVVKRPLRDAQGGVRGVLCYARDLTPHQRAEAALRESEARFRAVVGNIPGIVYRCEVESPYRELYVSPGIEELTGWPVAEYLASGVTIIPDEDRPAVIRAVAAAVATRSPYQVRYRIRRRNGEFRWVEDHGRASYDDSGTARWLDGVIIDVTHTVTAEDAAREAEERFRNLVDNVPGVVYRAEVAFPWRDIFLSDGVERLTGFPTSRLLGPAGQGYGELILAEDREGVVAAVEAAVRARTPFAIRYRLRRADGGIRWVEEQGVAHYDADGRALWLDGVITDVTARREAEAALHQSEARLRTIIDHNPDCVALLDRHGALLDMNPAGLALVEAPSLEAVVGRSICGMLEPTNLSGITADLAAVFQGETRRFLSEITALQGTRKVIESTMVPLWEDAERRTVRAALLVTQDITERRRLELQLRQAQKMEALGTLAGGIAHDFNNILAAVIGHTELLRPLLPAGAEGQEHLRGILTAGQRARDLIQQILTFSRGREPERVPVAVAEMLAEALRLLRPSTPATVELVLPPVPADLAILADPTQVQQVLLNLCGNAAQAMPGGHGRITIAAEHVELADAAAGHPELPPGRYVRLVVADTGSGMSPEVLERIFDPFYTTKAPGAGTGLGLAVVHGIMVANGGAVMVRSTPGQGSAFHLYFPRAELPAGARPRQSGPTRAVPPGEGQRILVVDDEPPLVAIACRALERRGWRASGHTRPADALAALRAAPGEVDLVLCDLTMPQLSGLDLAREVRALRPDLPILLMTGYAGAVDPAELAGLGILELVEKPFMAAHLVEVIARHLPRPGTPAPA
ncbi:MAG: PAS domain-containing protein [Gemmatimonadetes bacterium]|nr:PAS domain-containing protein [Gemmatimonadota bacterium]